MFKLLCDIFGKLFKGIGNVIKSRNLKIGLLVVIILVSVSQKLMEQSMLRVCILFFGIPCYFFFASAFNPKKKNEIMEYKNYEYQEYVNIDNKPKIDSIQRETITTKSGTTITNEIVNYKNYYLE